MLLLIELIQALGSGLWNSRLSSCGLWASGLWA